MKRICAILLCAIMALALCACHIPFCDEYNYLHVQCSAGVSGTPESGEYRYDVRSSWRHDHNTDVEVVEYHYELKAGYTDLRVLLDGHAVDASGTIEMDRDHRLEVSAKHS